MSAPALLIDAGNSRIKWALADTQGALGASGAFEHAGEGVPDDPDWSALPAPRGAWISNVAGPAAAARIDALLDARWPGLPRTTIRACAAQCGVVNGYTTPEQLGSDRWAGMIGARAAFPDAHLLIATFGTATTLEALRADGRFTGGLIAPGWALMMRALGTHTAQLPTLTTDAATRLLHDAGPHGADAPFAVDTPHSLSAGCLYAQAGLIERAARDLAAAWHAPVRLVLSGGAADAIAQALTLPYTRHDTLVLSGLARIAQAA
ncbi:type III pantothenate kinase [Burkholderia alba]|uniref:type III pantothenate kinase n=1 Tax=Burkholderia alba TaxID=2683677 RepID=UPI002B0549AB|nr:type III pantothenate kinase [Burkholderia alba]